jgi:hypothetical protein
MHLDPTTATQPRPSRVGLNQNRVARQTPSPFATWWQKAAVVDITMKGVFIPEWRLPAAIFAQEGHSRKGAANPAYPTQPFDTLSRTWQYWR